MLCYIYVICVFCRLVVLVRLSEPVQVIDLKDSSSKWPIMCWWGRKTLLVYIATDIYWPCEGGLLSWLRWFTVSKLSPCTHVQFTSWKTTMHYQAKKVAALSVHLLLWTAANCAVLHGSIEAFSAGTWCSFCCFWFCYWPVFHEITPG